MIEIRFVGSMLGAAFPFALEIAGSCMTKIDSMVSGVLLLTAVLRSAAASGPIEAASVRSALEAFNAALATSMIRGR